MKIIVMVEMKAEYLYDLFLHHMYSTAAGFCINLAGLALIMGGGFLLKFGHISFVQSLGYVALGAVVIGYTPLSLRLKAKKTVAEAKYQSFIHYSFDGDGICEVVGAHKKNFAWSDIIKAVSTPKNIAFYLPSKQIIIIPKVQFKNNFMPVMHLVLSNVSKERIFIR